MPPSLEELSRRIENRHRETSSKEIAKRLRMARKEIASAGDFDFCVVNADLAQAIKKLKGIVNKKLK